jgi:autotransporter translocation and assembly factor TamB
MRIVRRLVHVLVIVLTLVVGAAAAAIIVSQTAWFKDWLRGYIEREANQYLNGRLSIQRLGGNLFFGVELENIGISMDGSQVVAVKDLGLDYSVFEFISKGLSVNEIRIDKPVLYLRRAGDAWSISRLVKKESQEANRSGPGRPIAIDEIGVSDGSVVVDGPVGTSGVDVPKRFDHLDAKLSFKYEPVKYSIEISHVSFRGSDPAIALNALSGGVSVRNDTLFVDKLALRTAETSLSLDGAVQQYLTKPIVKLRLTSDKLSLPEISRVVPALAGINLQPAFEVTVDGPMDRLGVDLNLRASAGQMRGKLVADVLAPGQSVNGTLSVRHLDLAPIVKSPKQKSDITADATVDARAASFSDLNTVRGSLVVNAPRIRAAGYDAGPIKAKADIEGRQIAVEASAAAYAARATLRGRVTLPDTARASKTSAIAFDVNGQARDLDLRRLPRDLKIPAAATNVNADYHAVGSIATAAKSSGVDVTADARFLPSTVAGATIAGGSTVGVSMHGKDLAYSADATVSHLDLQRAGEEFHIPALAIDRYKGIINAHLAASGRGTAIGSMDVKANGTLSDTSILGGTIPQLTFDAAVANDTAHVKANGTFAGLDPSVASGKPQIKGAVGGSVDVDATLNQVSRGVALDTVQASAKLALTPSTIGGLEITRANVDADYHDSTGDIRAFEIVGRDVNVAASGTLAMNETGQSNLKLHADSPSLDRLGKLVNQPLTGIAKVDATITGSRQALQAAGNVTGDGVKYGANGALALSTDFTASIPDLDAAQARVSTTTHGTFVTVGGQNINDLTAKADYANKELTFDAAAKQPKRSLNAAGTLLMHPDHQEIHLQNFGLQSQGVQWQTVPGASATIQYGSDAVTVQNLKLVNGNQEIAAEGTFGKPDEALKVTVNNVDVATVDALLLREPQLSGRLNASSTIAGSKDAPEVTATFAINQGGFRQFRYDTFGGTIRYAGPGMTVDARLQQNPTTWLEAKGYVPTAAFSATNAAREHRPAGARENSFDLHVDSSPIDLGVVQGFTTQLTNVKGTVQAKVDVTGAADDPHPLGSVTVQNAAFTVQPTGVTYTDLDGAIDLRPDAVHIDQIRVLDNQQKPLTIAGDLAIHERQVGGVAIAVKSNDFKVIDNKMGNVRINSDLRLTGELNAPRLEGTLGVTTGTINLDPILALAGNSAYATAPAQYGPGTPSEPSAGEPAAAAYQPSRFDALQMDVHLTVPNDLVIKASDLRAPGAPISLGALNLTLGGDLYASKVPYDQLRLIGIVNAVRGTYDFQSRRFTILRDGNVRFEGTDDIDPALDIRTQRVIQAVTANVNLQGTLKNPKIVLSSTPPLEQADILSLIVFNQNLNSVGEGQQISLAQRAEGMAAGAAAGQLAKSIGNALNLDTFEINTAPESGGAAELTVGQQVGQNLYVKVQQGIGDQSQTNVILEYELTKWLRLQTNVLQGSTTQQQLFQRMQGSGIDLLFFFSY